MNLEEFVKSDYRNAWIYERGLSAYVRKSKRFIDEQVVDCIDVANVSVDESLRGQGIFKDFLGRVEGSGFSYVMVENVMNKFLPGYLLTVGYVERDVIPGCYVKCCLDRKAQNGKRD